MSGFAGAIPMLGGLSMRFTTPADDQFVLDLFMAGREWLAMGSNDRDFVRFLYEDQLRITRLGHGGVYPEHLDFVVEKTGQAVGHLVVDLGYADWRITQFEIHPQARGKGIGGDVIRSLQHASSNGKLPLSVSTAEILIRSIAFYMREGFRIDWRTPPMVGLAWYPPGRPWPTHMAFPPHNPAQS